jgi:hypothetical protein
MAIRGILRGTVPWSKLEAVSKAVLSRYNEPAGRVRFLDADNWLSTPMVVNERWFVKLITSQNSLVHALLTTGRNIGAFSAGTEGFFQHFGTPYQMATHEREATEQMRELGVNAPEPIEAFEHDGMGVLVLEYLPAFRTLDTLSPETIEYHAPTVFEFLRRMHNDGLAHGDFRCENVLVADGDVYFIDATSVRETAIADAQAYDLACALGALEPLIGHRPAVGAAREHYTTAELLDAEEFLSFVNLRPDHDFAADAIRGAIEHWPDD